MTTPAQRFTAMLDSMTDAQLEAYAASLAANLPTDAQMTAVQQHIIQRNIAADHLTSMFNVQITSILGSK